MQTREKLLTEILAVAARARTESEYCPKSLADPKKECLEFPEGFRRGVRDHFDNSRSLPLNSRWILGSSGLLSALGSRVVTRLPPPRPQSAALLFSVLFLGRPRAHSEGGRKIVQWYANVGPQR